MTAEAGTRMKRTIDNIKAGWTWGKDIWAVEWLFDDVNSTDTKLIFLSYDISLSPIPMLSKWEDVPNRNDNIKKALSILEGINADVWLDDIKIKEVQE